MLLNRRLQSSINGKCVQQSLQPKHHHIYTQLKLVSVDGEVKFNTLYLSKHDLQVSSDVPNKELFGSMRFSNT